MANSDIRALAKKDGIRLWEVADHIGTSEATVTRMLRKELPESRKAALIKAIEEIKEGKEGAAAV